MVSTAQCAKQSTKDWNCKSPRFSLNQWSVIVLNWTEILGTARFLPERIYRWLPSYLRPKNHHLIMHQQQQQQQRSEMVSLKTEEQQWSITNFSTLYFRGPITRRRRIVMMMIAIWVEIGKFLPLSRTFMSPNVFFFLSLRYGEGDAQQCVHVYESSFFGSTNLTIIIFLFYHANMSLYCCRHNLA